ncbi:MAG: tRNA (adenosine(37)-N6)-threonylcarbamoyltransferase complex dimerization subunit type 1 TsaB [Burkholderiaceae bacterium]
MPARASTVLAIDSATDVCSVAVLHGRQVIELVETVGHKHSERALPMIDAAISQAGLVLSDIDIFAFGAGPGSFTGLRIACGIAQGLAYGKGKQVVPVGNLRALAGHAFSSIADGDLLLAAIDARMNEAYCAIYRRDPQVSEVRAPALERPQSLVQLADEGKVDIVAGNALMAFSNIWPHDKLWVALPDATSSAASIATLARFDASRGLAVAPEQAAPIYVRDHVALTIEERKVASAAGGRAKELARINMGGPRVSVSSAKEEH